MKQSGSLRVFLAATLVASSIMAMKIVMPSAPLGATVVAAVLGLVLIFSLFRTDARRRREVAGQAAAGALAPAQEFDSGSIRRRLESRPVPQVSAGPLSRDMNARPAKEQAPTQTSCAGTLREAPPVLELVQPGDDAEPAALSGQELPIAPQNTEVPVLDLGEKPEWLDTRFESPAAGESQTE